MKRTCLQKAQTPMKMLTDEYIPIGPVKVRVRLPEDVHGRNVQLLVSDQKNSSNVEKGWVQFTASSILDHEVVVVS